MQGLQKRYAGAQPERVPIDAKQGCITGCPAAAARVKGSAACAARPCADINQSATYTAYRVAGTNTFRLIVPPCTINNATIWLRTGDNLQNRYSMPLNSGSSFTPEAGTRYHLTMTL